jgi:hypothetical protein
MQSKFIHTHLETVIHFFVKILQNAFGRIRYTDCINGKKIYKLSNNLYDSVNYGHDKTLNYKTVPINTAKKMYFEGSIGGGLGKRNRRAVLPITGLLSVGYQFTENWGLGVSTIGSNLLDEYYIQKIKSVSIDTRFFSRKNAFTLHLGMVTKRTKLQGSDKWKFDDNTKKFNPSVGLSFRRFMRNNFMVGMSGVFSNFPSVSEEYDTNIIKNYNESIVAISLQLGFIFPKRLKDVDINIE